MNKKMFLIILILIIIGCFIFSRYNTNWITDNEFLYDKAIKYVVKETTNESYDKNKDDYKVFTDYHGFGIEERNNKKYVYMWILMESYYVEDNTLKTSEGSSMAYKFTFKNNKVIKYELPEDGSSYTNSIRKMFPSSIKNKVLNYDMDNSKLNKKVKKYYSYLNNTGI